MSTRKKMLAAAGALILIGVLLFALQPGPPGYECAPKNTPSSGFTEDGGSCAITIKSYEKRADFDSKPKPFRIAGLLFVVVGVGTGVVGLVRGRSKPDAASDAV